MSVEKKARVQEGFLNKVLGNPNLYRCVLQFVCVVDLLSLSWCDKLCHRRVSAYWKNGMLQDFTAMFYRRTGLTEAHMTRVREAGGFFTGFSLAQLFVKPEWRAGPTTEETTDFILPFGWLTPEILYRDRETHPLLDSSPRRRDDYNVHQSCVRSRSYLGEGFIQESCIWTPAVADHERSWVYTTNQFKYLGVDYSPADYVYDHSTVQWDRCTFNGQRLRIANVAAFVERRSPYHARHYTVDFRPSSHKLDKERATRSCWARLNLIVDASPLQKIVAKRLVRPKQNRSRYNISVGNVIKL